MKKKFLFLVALAVMLTQLAGCGAGDSASMAGNSAGAESSGNSVVNETPADDTLMVSEAPTEDNKSDETPVNDELAPVDSELAPTDNESATANGTSQASRFWYGDDYFDMLAYFRTIADDGKVTQHGATENGIRLFYGTSCTVNGWKYSFDSIADNAMVCGTYLTVALGQDFGQEQTIGVYEDRLFPASRSIVERVIAASPYLAEYDGDSRFCPFCGADTPHYNGTGLAVVYEPFLHDHQFN